MYLYSLCKYSPFVVVIWSRHFQGKQGSWWSWKTESELRFELAFVNAGKNLLDFHQLALNLMLLRPVLIWDSGKCADIDIDLLDFFGQRSVVAV